MSSLSCAALTVSPPLSCDGNGRRALLSFSVTVIASSLALPWPCLGSRTTTAPSPHLHSPSSRLVPGPGAGLEGRTTTGERIRTSRRETKDGQRHGHHVFGTGPRGRLLPVSQHQQTAIEEPVETARRDAPGPPRLDRAITAPRRTPGVDAEGIVGHPRREAARRETEDATVQQSLAARSGQPPESG